MYQSVVFIHVVAALVWVGGMLFLPLVLVPVLRGQPAPARAAMMDAIGRRFRAVGWTAIAALLLTGFWNLHNRHLGWDTILSSGLFRGDFGRTLAVKLVLVGLVLLLSAVHDFWLGPTSTRAAREGAAGDERRRERLRRRASWIGRFNALLALVIIWLGVLLVRGLPW